jgi:ABC-2 type transport system ATP-binding protein
LYNEETMISVENLFIQFSSIRAIEDVSFTLQNGILYGMVGPNGAGKSSLIKCLVGIISEYSGNISYDNLPVKHHRHEIKKKLGYAPEDIELLPFLTGKEYLKMLADLRNLSKSADDISYLLNSLGMDEKKDIIIDQYSHGMKQKLSLASALIGNPETIILDEALNGLDPMSLFNMKKKLKELSRTGSTVLLSSHSLELVENLCQQILILNKGKLVRQISQKDLQDIKEKEGKEFSDYFFELTK